jgi:hypothetical protein
MEVFAMTTLVMVGALLEELRGAAAQQGQKIKEVCAQH